MKVRRKKAKVTCFGEGEGERHRRASETAHLRKGGGERGVCVCVCVCVRDRESTHAQELGPFFAALTWRSREDLSSIFISFPVVSPQGCALH